VEQLAADVHLAACFGLVAREIGVDAQLAAAAYLQQSIAGLVGACQRLLPLGQTRAQQILWNVKPVILRVAAESQRGGARVAALTPLLDTMSARHPNLHTRLFMS